jgi:hypothetical protein
MNLLMSKVEWVDYLDSEGHVVLGRYQRVKGLLPRLWDSIAWKILNKWGI